MRLVSERPVCSTMIVSCQRNSMQQQRCIPTSNLIIARGQVVPSATSQARCTIPVTWSLSEVDIQSLTWTNRQMPMWVRYFKLLPSHLTLLGKNMYMGKGERKDWAELKVCDENEKHWGERGKWWEKTSKRAQRVSFEPDWTALWGLFRKVTMHMYINEYT